MNIAVEEKVDRSAILNLRTSAEVHAKLKERAAAEERSVNWVLDRLVRSALGLEKAA